MGVWVLQLTVICQLSTVNCQLIVSLLYEYLITQNKNAVICGSSQGIGLAAAKELALNGANCFLMARNPETLQAGGEQFIQIRCISNTSGIAVDFTDPSAVEEAIKKLTSELTHRDPRQQYRGTESRPHPRCVNGSF